MEYLSIKQTSDKWGISVRRIQVLCSEDRIPGATKIGSYWAIPADAEKPNDQRIKSGKYVKEKDPVCKKEIWDFMIAFLPSSYNQISTMTMSYAVLSNIYTQRKNHKLTEWHQFCDWIETLPMYDLITGE